jgi:hypothetical protein
VNVKGTDVTDAICIGTGTSSLGVIETIFSETIFHARNAKTYHCYSRFDQSTLPTWDSSLQQSLLVSSLFARVFEISLHVSISFCPSLAQDAGQDFRRTAVAHSCAGVSESVISQSP